jgi:hypothetical protein
MSVCILTNNRFAVNRFADNRFAAETGDWLS